MHKLQQNLPQQIKDFVKDELDSRNLFCSNDVNKIKGQIQESFDMNQYVMTDTLEELKVKANKVGAFTSIKKTPKCDIVEVEDEVGVVEEMIDKDLADKQKAPTKQREFGCWAHYWSGKICMVPSDFVLPKSKPFLNLWLS